MIVDTSVWIDYFNGHPSREAQRLARAIEDGELIGIPGLVLTEILLGLKNDAEAQRIGSLLDAIDWIAEPSKADYAAAAEIYRACRAQGITVRSTIDCLIAQLAIREQRAVLAKDRDFAAIAKIKPLRLVGIE